ncbi:MAG: ABC transporter ATP-binding protein/permease [gamma proteobacterium symbiont of Bathyaustriella thionipta]|nr:ABC transporter ATP-binding protein/permease [gamma proteobacterium symbiont of Bathyaustriella thionipta]MCU7950610.1 ABC transporter ATP-binding protein/permease [gamma proteobacterium symbiont of Bathyaustriella thionipta]MCU7953956.1 ABC transporter ATP-binding protein/permease [gamma proteobacterium symbiont of Bathyaustriella thionipta]MCU7957118.1 ABC transporter ATP-binding protein/permease [gamma proteobacterium symbiont of Bathyaustriella thionipta]MCU7965946.1 ABC transporter ATP-
MNNTSDNTLVKQKESFSFKRIIESAIQYKKQLIYANIIAIVAALLSVPIPLILPLMVDEVLLNKPAESIAFMNQFLPVDWHIGTIYIITALIFSVFLRLCSVVLNVWQMRIFTILAKSITLQMREKLSNYLKKIAISEYETVGSGGFASHFVTDIEVVDQFISATISKFIVAVLSIIGTAVVLLWIDWQLAMILLFFNPLVIFLTMRMGKKVKKLKLRENNAIALFQQALVETLDAIHQIRAANREQHYIKRLITQAAEVKKYSIAYSWKTDAASQLSHVVFLFGFDMFRAVSMIMVLTSDLSIGLMFAVFGYLWYMMGPVQEVLNIQYAYYSARASINRLNKIFALKQEPFIPCKTDPFKEQQTIAIKLDRICFNYPNSSRNQDELFSESISEPESKNNDYILNKLSLTINKGEKVALVGSSGGGKSTLIQILLGLYPVESGDIYFDNVPISEIGFDKIRENTAAVLQHPVLFNDSVRTNLSLGNELSDESLWQALEIAQLDSTVKQLPEQLDTMVGRQGIRLSGGQRQRLAIARMILTNPKLIILDEATSALDTETENNLHTSLKSYLSDKTTLIIAHRLSAVKQADRIVVIDNGKIIADGTHQELVHSNELYFRLYGIN